MSPELEQTLSMLSSHRSVLGYLLLSRGHPVSIIRHSGVIFEGEHGRKYAGVIGRIVESVQTGLEEVNPDDTEVVRSSCSLLIPGANSYLLGLFLVTYRTTFGS